MNVLQLNHINGVMFTDGAAGSTGDVTINKQCGRVKFAASATTLTVTNSFAFTSSHFFVSIHTADATAELARVPAVCTSNGSFTINLRTAPTAATDVDFFIANGF